MKDTKLSDVLSILQSRRLLSTNIKVIAIPFLGILIISSLFFVTITQGLPKVSTQFRELETSQEKENQLTAKLNDLRSIQPGILENTNKTLIALPEGNPATYLISLVKTFSEDKELSIDKITMLAVQTQLEDIDTIQLELEMEGEAADVVRILDFLKSLQGTLPISNIVEQEYRASQASTTSTVILEIYWSQLPTEIPPIDQPVNKLTESETALLNRIVRYRLPEFTTLDAVPPSDRQNPFE